MNSNRRSRTERQKLGRLALTERDRAIVSAVYRFRFLTSGQIADRFFASKSKADRRLRMLYDHGFLDRIERPVASGRSELIYALWTRGADLIANDTPLPVGPLHWKRSMNAVKPDRMQHELDIVYFQLAMDRSVTNTVGVDWLFWLTRQEIVTQKDWRLITSGQSPNSTIKLIPDAFFALQTRKGKTAFFLEVDRGTERTSVFRNKLLAYQASFESRAIQKTTGFRTFRALTVVPSLTRRNNLLKEAGRMKHPLLYWFALYDELSKPDILSIPIWSLADEPDSLTALLSQTG